MGPPAHIPRMGLSGSPHETVYIVTLLARQPVRVSGTVGSEHIGEGPVADATGPSLMC